MKAALIRKDSMVLARDVTTKVVLAGIVLLLLAALAAGLQREAEFEKERTAAAVVDKEVWMEQGERNPHSAAHFSRYAFRPPAPLGLIDPGVDDFAGIAIWMEGHHQNPADFRRAEDAGELSRYTLLSPAFLVLVAGPLLILLLLHDSVAGEREDKTLRQLLATGVTPGAFIGGKLLAALRTILPAFVVLFVILAAVSLYYSPAGERGDTAVRLLVMFISYTLYLSAFAVFAVGASALFRSRRQAFLALAGVWVLVAIVVPRLAAEVGVSLYPQPNTLETTTLLSTISNTYWDDEAMKKELRETLLAEYEVDDLSELPFNFSAYQLQYSEEVADPLFDELYADLRRNYQNQEDVMAMFSLLSPSIAAARLSAGIAGTDRLHQQDFTGAAEKHRRTIVKQLNDDYMLNAGTAGSSYTSDATLWAQIDDFGFRPLDFSTVYKRYLGEFGMLVLWLVLAFLFTLWSGRRAVLREVNAS